MSDALPSTIRVSEAIVARPMEGGAVLVNTLSGDCYELNALGAEIWNELERGVPLPTVVEALAKRYDVDHASVTADVRRLIDDLVAHAVVTMPGT